MNYAAKIIFTLTTGFILGCSEAGNDHIFTGGSGKDTTNFSRLLTQADAEKIMGEKCSLENRTTESHKNVIIYQCAYKAMQQHEGKPRQAALYMLVEQFGDLRSAMAKYSVTKKANEDHGIKVLDDIGEEAYFHSDNENFYFIMCRKGNTVFNMKLNLLTSGSSLEEFNATARRICREL